LLIVVFIVLLLFDADGIGHIATEFGTEIQAFREELSCEEGSIEGVE
jgi:Sec-independent protein translocase protein TatA